MIWKLNVFMWGAVGKGQNHSETNTRDVVHISPEKKEPRNVV